AAIAEQLQGVAIPASGRGAGAIKVGGPTDGISKPAVQLLDPGDGSFQVPHGTSHLGTCLSGIASSPAEARQIDADARRCLEPGHRPLLPLRVALVPRGECFAIPDVAGYYELRLPGGLLLGVLVRLLQLGAPIA